MKLKYPRKSNLSGTKYGEFSQLEVLDKISLKYYEVCCSICATDAELHEEAVYQLSSGDISKGVIPCGCSKSPRWKPCQKEILIKREVIHHSKVALLLNQDDFRKVDLICLLHGKEFKSNYYNIQKGKNLNCKECLAKITSDSRKLSLDECREVLCEIQPNLKIVGNSAGKGLVVTCDICSEDVLVQEGLCSGLFTKSFFSLKRGEKPCRCYKQYTYTVPQRVRLIEYMLEKLNQNYEFVHSYRRLESHGGRKCFEDWGQFYCKSHGVFHRSLSRMLRMKQGCPTCDLKFGGFDEKRSSVFYIMKILGREVDFVKFGISGQFNKRLTDHKTNLKKSGFYIDSIETYSLSGANARSLEGYVKKEFDLVPINVKGFRTESIDIKNYLNLKNFVNKYLDTLE